MKILFVIVLNCLGILSGSYCNAQMFSVSGFVTNQLTGEIEKNATIYETISGVGTISNEDGHYRLLLKKGPHKLEITSSGCHPFTASFELIADTIISAELVPIIQPGGKTNLPRESMIISLAGTESQPSLHRGSYQVTFY